MLQSLKYRTGEIKMLGERTEKLRRIASIAAIAQLLAPGMTLAQEEGEPQPVYVTYWSVTVDANGNITAKSSLFMEALQYAPRTVPPGGIMPRKGGAACPAARPVEVPLDPANDLVFCAKRRLDRLIPGTEPWNSVDTIDRNCDGFVGTTAPFNTPDFSYRAECDQKAIGTDVKLAIYFDGDREPILAEGLRGKIGRRILGVFVDQDFSACQHPKPYACVMGGQTYCSPFPCR
jgi:hypothetical protein